jgi:hypothetical protein
MFETRERGAKTDLGHFTHRFLRLVGKLFQVATIEYLQALRFRCNQNEVLLTAPRETGGTIPNIITVSVGDK